MSGGDEELLGGVQARLYDSALPGRAPKAVIKKPRGYSLSDPVSGPAEVTFVYDVPVSAPGVVVVRLHYEDGRLLRELVPHNGIHCTPGDQITITIPLGGSS